LDVTALASLANAIFREVPGGAPAGLPVNPPASPAGMGPPAGGPPPLGGFGYAPPPVSPPVAFGLPMVAPNRLVRPATPGLPVTPQTGLPAGGPPPLGGFGFLPPPLSAPSVSPLPVSGFPELPPNSLFGAVPAAPAFPPTAPAAPEFSLASIPPLSASLPQEAELRALLAPLLAAPGRPAPAAIPGEYSGLPAQPAPTPDYYFLQPEATPAIAAGAHPAFNAELIARDFPILSERVNGKKLIWLDNAATTQKPHAVIERLKYFYEHENSNIHRAAHELAARSTDAYEKARETVRRFINAGSAEEIIFVRGATEGINLVAQTYGKRFVRAGDEILVTQLEHHANIVPWQFLAAEAGAKLVVAPVDDSGQVLLHEYEKLLTARTRIVAFTHVSNALGTVTPAKQMIALAHRRGARVLLDGAQSISHMPIDVRELDPDWYIFSGHKVFGPTGIGAVYGKKAVLDDSPPWQGGGNMIRDVTFEKTEFQDAPFKFEAGTGNIADAAGLGAALEYLEGVGMEAVAAHEHSLIVYATERLAPIPRLRIIGTAAEKAGVVSFVLDGIAPEAVGRALNEEGIAVRSGHHCAQPILRRFGLEATVRPSFALYNTFAEIDALAAAVRRIAVNLGG